MQSVRCLGEQRLRYVRTISKRSPMNRNHGFGAEIATGLLEIIHAHRFATRETAWAQAAQREEGDIDGVDVTDLAEVGAGARVAGEVNGAAGHLDDVAVDAAIAQTGNQAAAVVAHRDGGHAHIRAQGMRGPVCHFDDGIAHERMHDVRGAGGHDDWNIAAEEFERVDVEMIVMRVADEHRVERRQGRRVDGLYSAPFPPEDARAEERVGQDVAIANRDETRGVADICDL